MTAVHLYTYDNPPPVRDIERACRVLAEDGVIAYPSDSNWAFACDAGSHNALERIHALKPSHPKDRPFALVCSTIAMAAEYGVIDHNAYRWLKKAWPGPFTVLLVSARNLPRQLKDKRRIVGIRIPRCSLLRAIIDSYGKPLATASIPIIDFGLGKNQEPYIPQFGYQVADSFGHALDLILDLGTELSGAESTIIDLTSGLPEVIRLGVGDPAIFDIV